MKNPLLKRLPRELIGDIGKYLAVFLFMTATIGFVSGFLVADDSMLAAYQESFEKYHIEDGNFTLEKKATDSQIKRLEKEGVQIYENYYVEEDADTDLDGEKDSTVRVYKNRSQIDLVCLMKGELPKKEDEIAIDRMYAENNKIQISDIIKVGKEEKTVTGYVALSDYSALFSNNSDMMFDAVKFGVAIVTDEAFDNLEETHLKYRYSWTYDDPPQGEKAEKERSDDFLEILADYTSVTGYIPRYANQAIHFTGDDMGSDRSMMIVLLYILIAIMAFVFAVTTNNTIVKEAAVIGTLRASGYTRKELLVHYMTLPLLVTVIAAVIGNVLGYTVFKNICAGMYYGSYSLPTYETRWNMDAFVLTTIVPFVIMLLVNLLLISKRLKLTPLKFLRRDLSTSKKQKAVKLPDIRFFDRFRLRIILQNKSSYITLFVGIVFANILLLFGMMMAPLLDHYQEQTVDNMIADYQYILNVPDEIDEDDTYTLYGALSRFLTPSLETENKKAEKFCMESLETVPGKRDSESVTVYGTQQGSHYMKTDFPDEGVYVSDGYAEKYNIKTGDTIWLKETYGDKTYSFAVKGIYVYPSGLSVFMSMPQFCRVFEKSDTYFNGYFSNEKITDIEEAYIASTITQDDLTKISRQLDVSMGNMFQLINVFAVVLFALLIYLLTKLIIEKNEHSISMVKILGYENDEIVRLYLVSTSWVVAVSVLLSLWIATWTIKVIYVYMMAEFSGWLSLYIEPAIYWKMFLMGMAVYALVALLQFFRISKIPMETALKNIE